MPTPANDLNIQIPGYVVFDGTATFTGRTFQAGTGVTITNASGISGNTTISATGSGGMLNKVITQIFTSTGTYTPSAGMLYCTVQLVGGGGGGGGIGATSAVQVAAAGGGAGGSYAIQTFTAAAVGASQSVIIGAAGAAGTNTPTNGGQGSSSIFGVIFQATGGGGGALGSPVATFGTSLGGIPGSGSNGDVATLGSPGGVGFCIFNVTPLFVSGIGGSSYFGGGGVSRAGSTNTGSSGFTALSYGGGGGGAAGNNSIALSGGAGFKGIAIITEYTT